jgi:hypothetical protein
LVFFGADRVVEIAVVFEAGGVGWGDGAVEVGKGGGVDVS